MSVSLRKSPWLLLALGLVLSIAVAARARAQTPQAVASLTLINADTDLPVAGFDPIPPGATIDLAALPTLNLNIRANTTPATVGSVRFRYDTNTNYRTDNAAPYAIASETSGNYAAWTPSLGSHTIGATPYTGASAGGTAGTVLTMTVFVMRSRINAGGPAYADTSGKVWTADAGFAGGNTYSAAVAISGTVEDTLYQSERYGNSSYSLPVPNGPYAVTLHFAEIYFTSAGKRVFNVMVEGQLAIDHLDIWAAAGANAALTRTVQTTVSDGVLNISFVNVVENAKVSAIEIAALPQGNQPPVVNAGADRTITLPTDTVALTGTASDDAQPAPPALTYTWSMFSGPAPVTFSAPTALATNATFTQVGTYTLRLSVSDSALTTTDDLVVTVNPVATNQAPVVNAGADRSITLPTNSVALTGTASDDALPAPPATLTYGWSLFSGPAAVTFSTPTSLSTTATFSTAGTYTLRLTVSDSALTTTDDLVVTVDPASAFVPIRINAGGPAYTDSLGQAWAADNNFSGGNPFTTTTAIAGTPDQALYKSERYGNFSYNIPVPNGSYTVTLHFAEIYWTSAGKRVFNVSIEGQPAISSLDIWAAAGANTALIRTVQATVTDGTLNILFSSVVDYAKVSAIQVAAVSGTNQPPAVNAGLDRAITLPATSVALAGTASDDGLPAPPSTLTYGWSTVSGPAAVTFSTSTALATTATFTATGTYTLRLTANDSALSSSDDVIVTVNPASANQAPVVNAGADRSITLPVSAVSLTATATDDGLPTPPGTVTYAWTVVSGPAAVTFSAPSALTTSATFTTAGSYTLRFTANDSAVSGSDDIVVTVSPAASFAPVLINAGGPAYTDSTGQVWAADKLFSGGSTYTTATAAIAGTVEDTLYRTERFGNFSYAVPVPNATYVVTLHLAEIYWTGPGQRVFNVLAEGNQVVNTLDMFAAVGTYAALDIVVEVPVNDGVLNLDFVSLVDNAKLSALEIRQHPGDPFLHVVIGAPAYAVDYDSSGSEVVAVRGQDSHTHELGHHIVSWVWTEGATVLGTTPNLSVPLSLGSHTLSLTIQDDNVPPRSLTDSVVVPVYALNAVSGALARYFPAGSTPLATLIDALPTQPGFVEVLPTLRVDPVSGKFSGSPYSSNVIVTLTASYTVATPGTYQFVLSGGSATRLFVNASPVTGPLALSPGTYALEARFAVPSAASLPAEVTVSIGGAAAIPIPGTVLSHDETAAAPFINSMPASGSALGGEVITISGFGFFPASAVTVHWGAIVLPASAVFVTPTEITVTTPPGSGAILVSVETPAGASNSVTFTYDAGAVPVAFSAPQLAASPTNPTQAAWGPDGRLYVGTITGQIMAYTFDDNYAVTATQVIDGVSGLSNPMILGIAFNPFDPPSPVRVYVAHSILFAQGGTCFSGAAAYAGQVSRIDGPTFLSVTPIITRLPVSNHDHGVNGLVFDNNGDLLIAQGGNTNAGVAGNCNIGQLPESPLSAAILKARITRPGFNGAISYLSTATQQTQNDQNFGESVDVAPGVDLAVLAPGFRNPFDIVLTTEGRLFSTDNGPNDTFGAASTSAATQAPDPTAPDEIVRVVQGSYYGHPNRSRGRYNARENVYRAPDVPAILGQYTSPLATVASSSNGIEEYRATTFNSAMRGNLLVQKLDGVLYRASLNASGTAVTGVQTLASPVGLDVVSGPGGAILTIDYNGSQVKVMKPTDVGAPPVVAYDIFPWRGRADGTTPFVIGGAGFSAGGSTTVTIGGTVAVVTSVSPTRIRGLIPAKVNQTANLVDVVVQSGGQVSTIPRAFRYLLSTGVGAGAWQSGPTLPQSIGEVAGGVIDGVLYMVGENNAATYAFDLATETWQTVASRPHVGDHHAAEVINGKLYLFGGLDGGSEGQVQIYNPSTNSWSMGAPAPFATGSAATALINGLVYMAGGIAGSVTVNSAAVYNPATNAWAPIPNMPVARNHTAAGTDGQRFFIFGGRGPGSGDANVVADGFDDVQIYNPATNTWQCSCLAGSTLPPLPQKRGGMGKAAFYRGEFYVIGGETTPTGTGQVAGNVYNRVDVFNPSSLTWRRDAALPTARHGIFPLAYDDRIFVAGGGVQASQSASNVLEILAR